MFDPVFDEQKFGLEIINFQANGAGLIPAQKTWV